MEPHGINGEERWEATALALADQPALQAQASGKGVIECGCNRPQSTVVAN